MKRILQNTIHIALILFFYSFAYSEPYIVDGNQTAPHYGVYEVQLKLDSLGGNPYFDVTVQVDFTRPDGTKVRVDGFYDGNQAYKARAYCDQVGQWQWQSVSNHSDLDQHKGTFQVKKSVLKGKLRKHPEDPFQFMYDNGEWFLHIGDTGYRFVVQSEPLWKEYVDQAAEAGFTKIRTWFAQSRSRVEALYTEDRSGLALDYWQEIDRRIIYTLNHHPQVILQLIPYAEDTIELKRYGDGDRISKLIAQYAQARWSAFPNIHWTISNDREIVKKENLTGREIHADTINQIGRDMNEREPWGTLLANHQARFTGYAFEDAPWSDMILLEDIDQVAGEIILEFREKGDDPIVLDEDRYENYRNPANQRYFFRRYMWGILLSGGHATYGGLRTYEAYDGGPLRGVQGYYTANRRGVLSQGAHDYNHIHTFFKEAGITLVGMEPDDALVGNKPLEYKCIHNDDTYVIYLANPDGDDPRTDNPRVKAPQVKFKLPKGSYKVKWFNPRMGEWSETALVDGGIVNTYTPPDVGRISVEDWVLLIQKRS